MRRQEWCTGVFQCMDHLNDLIDPEAIPLDTPYGCTIISNLPVIIQFSRLDTSLPPKAIFSTLPYCSN